MEQVYHEQLSVLGKQNAELGYNQLFNEAGKKKIPQRYLF